MSLNSTISRLHFGCGQIIPQGWVNTDLSSTSPDVVQGDVLKGLPWADATFDYISSQHVLCELKIYDQVPALKELRRILKPDGVLRLSLPDLDRAIAAYQRRDADYFPMWSWNTVSGNFITYILWHNLVHTPFTFEFAQEVLQQAGFRTITQVAYQQTNSPWPEIVSLDNRPEESFYVEAVK